MIRVLAAAVVCLLVVPSTALALSAAWDDSVCSTGGQWFNPLCWGGTIPDGVDDSAFLALDMAGTIAIPTTVNLGIQLNGLTVTENITLIVGSNMYINMVRSTFNQDPTMSVDNQLIISSPNFGTSRLALADPPEGSPVLQILGVGEINLGANGGIQTGADGTIEISGGIEVYGVGTDTKPASMQGNFKNIGGEIVAVQGIFNLSGDIENQNGGFIEIDDQFMTGAVELVITGTVRGETIYPGAGVIKLQNGELAGISIEAGDVEAVSGAGLGGVVQIASATEIQVYQTQTLDIGTHPEEGAPLITNDGIIRLGTDAAGATLRSDGSHVELLGNGAVIMHGPGSSLSKLGGGLFKNRQDHTIEGQGFIQAQIWNYGLLVVDRGTLTNFESVLDFGGSTVVLGDPGTPATLSIAASFGTHDMTVTEDGRLNVNASRSIEMSGNYIVQSQDETATTWGASSTLVFSGGGGAQAFEITSTDMGSVNAGFTGNFEIPHILMHTAGTFVYLRDLNDNGNRNGANGFHEAVYTDELELLPGTTLDLNGYCLYAKVGGLPHRVAAGEGALFGGGTIVDNVGTDAPSASAVPGIREFRVSPNPFNPSTEIAFELGESSAVRIEAFDLRGRRVQTIVDGEHYGAGRQSVSWQPDGLASGHYFVRVSTGNDVATRSVTLVK